MSDILLLLAVIPAVMAFIGWITNWVGVKMIFHPERFIGIGPLGWQAIVVRRAPKFATGTAEMMTTKLISPREMAERLDPVEMEKVFEHTLEAEAAALVEEAAEIVQPGAWKLLPEPARLMVLGEVRNRTRVLVHELFDKLRGVSDELLDLKRLIYGTLAQDNARTMVRLFKEIGAKEFRFIVWSGAVFGFLIGLIQVAAWAWLQSWWVQPIVGVIVGLVTNWLAIQMIFRPMERRRYLGIPYQGLFPKRQLEIARDYGRQTADHVLTPRNLIRLVSEGEAGARIAGIVVETISTRIDEEWKKIQPMVPLRVTPEQLARIKAAIVQRITVAAPQVQPQLEEYLARKLDIARTIEQKLAGLSKHDFERVLRGIFEEDEIIVVLVGGFLGGAVGLLQAAWVLAQAGG